MQNPTLSEAEIQKFMQGCEDLTRLGLRFTENIRQAFEELKNTYVPAVHSQYVDPAVEQLLADSLKEFQRKLEANLNSLETACTKGGKWFAYYLGRAVEHQTIMQAPTAPQSPASTAAASQSEPALGKRQAG